MATSTAKPYGGALAPSLTACLRFAAPLLHPDMTPTQVCTKATLGAIVVDAHRLAQQVAAQKLASLNDPRRLLAKVSVLDDQLARVAFADITWDAESVATQTLEMEVQDVEERAAATLHRSVCVLLACHDGDTTETAVLWLPRATTDDGQSTNSSSSGKKYLLFVVPGRVKVVKSVAELVKKAYEEMPTLRLTSATYRVWTLVEATQSTKKIAQANALGEQPRKAGAPEQIAPECAPVVDRMNQTEGHKESHKKDTTLHELTPIPVSKPLLMRVHHKESIGDHASIFAFPRAATIHDDNRKAACPTLSPRVRVGHKAASPAPSCVSSASRHDAGMRLAESPMPLCQDEQRTRAANRRVGVASSLANHKQSGHRRELEDRDPGVWRSLESRIHRQQLAIKVNRKNGEEIPFESTSPRETTAIIGEQPQQPSPSVSKFVLRRPASPELHRFHQDVSYVQTNHGSSERIFDVRPPTSPETEAQLSPTEAAESSQVADVRSNQDPEEERKPPTKKRSARDHYRSKLGARGWWELEYQATKLLREVSRTQSEMDPRVQNEERLPTANKRIQSEVKKAAASAGVTSACHRGDLQIEMTKPLERPMSRLSSARSFSGTEMDRGHHGDDPRSGMVWAAHQSSREQDSPRGKKHNSVREEEEGEEDGPTWKVDERHSGKVRVAQEYGTPEEQLDKREPVVLSRQLGNACPREANEARRVSDDACSAIVSGKSAVVDGEAEFLRRRTSDSSTRGARNRTEAASRVVVDSVEAAITDAQTAPRCPTVRGGRLAETRSGLDSSDTQRGLQPRAAAPSTASSDSRSSRSSSMIASQPSSAICSSRFGEKEAAPPSLSDGEDDQGDGVLMAKMVAYPVSSCRSDGLLSGDGGEKQAWRPSSWQDRSDDAESAKPTSTSGNVPIRRPTRATGNAINWERQQEDEQNDDLDVKEPLAAAELKPSQLMTKVPRSQVPASVSTFTVESAVIAHDEATQQARQLKLAELRQRKIQQLQRTREDAQLKKPPQRSYQPPVTTKDPDASPPREKLAAAPPPSTMVGESCSLYGNGRVVRRPSNRKLIQNAVEYTLLAGGSLAKERHAAVQALTDSACDNFIVLLKSAKELKFRALYEHHIERGQVVKLFSVASSSPPVLTQDVISQFFRYNSGKKEFAPIDSRAFTVKTDACALVDQLVFKKKAALHHRNVL